jgi:hypothetical protein
LADYKEPHKFGQHVCLPIVVAWKFEG